MIDLNSIDKIYLYPGHVDLRKGMNSSGYLAAQIYKNDGLHKLFIFLAPRKLFLKYMKKILLGYGYMLED